MINAANSETVQENVSSREQKAGSDGKIGGYGVQSEAGVAHDPGGAATAADPDNGQGDASANPSDAKGQNHHLAVAANGIVNRPLATDEKANDSSTGGAEGGSVMTVIKDEHTTGNRSTQGNVLPDANHNSPGSGGD